MQCWITGQVIARMGGNQWATIGLGLSGWIRVVTPPGVALVALCILYIIIFRIYSIYSICMVHIIILYYSIYSIYSTNYYWAWRGLVPPAKSRPCKTPLHSLAHAPWMTSWVLSRQSKPGLWKHLSCLYSFVLFMDVSPGPLIAKHVRFFFALDEPATLFECSVDGRFALYFF